MERDIHISAAHIPEIHNVLADVASMRFHDTAECSIPGCQFKKILLMFGEPDIDLFASRINHQQSVYASWLLDPGSAYIDAMSFSWKNLFIYAFPPFSMIWPTIQKINMDKV